MIVHSAVLFFSRLTEVRSPILMDLLPSACPRRSSFLFFGIAAVKAHHEAVKSRTIMRFHACSADKVGNLSRLGSKILGDPNFEIRTFFRLSFVV